MESQESCIYRFNRFFK